MEIGFEIRIGGRKVAQCNFHKYSIYIVRQSNSWNIPSVSLGCWVGVLVYSSTFGHVPTCVYMSHRPNDSFVPEQQKK